MFYRLSFLFCVLSACCGLNVNAQEDDLRILLDQGQTLYRHGLADQAETSFRQAVAAFSGSHLAHYWLGMALYAQKKDKEALEFFKKTVNLNGRAKEGHTGIGLVYLRTPLRRFDARAAFQKAARLDPADADIQDYIGLTFVNTLGNRVEYGLDGRVYFHKAIALNPQHSNAYYHLGLTYEESPSRNYTDALPHYYDQLMATPDHKDALNRFVRCVIKTGQFGEGVDMLRELSLKPGVEHSVHFRAAQARLLAVAFAVEKDFPGALEQFERYIRALPDEERRWYTDLSLVASPSFTQLYEKADENQKRELWRRFWAERDPDPTTTVNERLVEHYRRVLYARNTFSDSRYPWDRRGEIYIRFGEPDNRQPLWESTAVETGVLPTGDGRVDSIREINRRLRYRYPWNGRGFAESWVYIPLNVEIIFTDPVGSGQFDYPPPSVDIRADRFHPKAVMAELIASRPEIYRYDYGGEPMEYLFDLITYRGANEKTEMEVLFSVPARQLGYTSDGRGDQTWFESHVVFRDANLERVMEEIGYLGPVARPVEKISKELASANVRNVALTMNAPPGRYRAAIALREAIFQKIGIYETPLTVSDYSGSDLNLSDLNLARSITPVSGTGPFVRRGLRILPNPTRRFKRFQPIPVYYEIYNLSRDEQGRTFYRTELEITAKEKSLHLFWRIVSGFGKLVKKTEENSSVVLTYEGEGVKPDEYRYTTLETEDSIPGDYTITLTVTDLHTDQKTVKTKNFEITDDLKQPVEDPTLDMDG